MHPYSLHERDDRSNQGVVHVTQVARKQRHRGFQVSETQVRPFPLSEAYAIGHQWNPHPPASDQCAHNKVNALNLLRQPLGLSGGFATD